MVIGSVRVLGSIEEEHDGSDNARGDHPIEPAYELVLGQQGKRILTALDKIQTG